LTEENNRLKKLIDDIRRKTEQEVKTIKLSKERFHKQLIQQD
jgi:hypothetical protein